MKKQWQSIIVTEIKLAVYVSSNTRKTQHCNRPFHGLVLNDSNGIKTYYFSDGQVMRTEENCLFYLPKGSSYRFESEGDVGCYAINFEAELEDAPFCVRLRDPEGLLHSFKVAAKAWKSKEELQQAAAMRAVYDAVYQMQKEWNRTYMPNDRMALLTPAIEVIEHDFTNSELSVSALASLCGMSEVYFRRLFANFFGVPPKEYLIRKRIDYAKSLLCSESFSVSEIAQLCGYAESCHFSREFSRRVGVSPRRFQGK